MQRNRFYAIVIEGPVPGLDVKTDAYLVYLLKLIYWFRQTLPVSPNPTNFGHIGTIDVLAVESKLFNCVPSSPQHVLYQLLSTLPSMDNNMIRKNSPYRMLFMDVYWGHVLCFSVFVCK